jgi:hypothetical protein
MDAQSEPAAAPPAEREGDFELCTLRSGARAVRHVGHGEVMHPAGGPWEEANRLYVDQPQLAARLRAARRPVCVFDIGLGAATNAVAALACARQAGGALELHSFELDLAPPDVERGQDLVVRRGRGVGHVGLVEGLFGLLLEVLIPHMDHRALPQRGQRLVGRLRRVHAHAHLRRICPQAHGHQLLDVCRPVGRQRLLESGVGRRVVGA